MVHLAEALHQNQTSAPTPTPVPTPTQPNVAPPSYSDSDLLEIGKSFIDAVTNFSSSLLTCGTAVVDILALGYRVCTLVVARSNGGATSISSGPSGATEATSSAPAATAHALPTQPAYQLRRPDAEDIDYLPANGMFTGKFYVITVGSRVGVYCDW
jgi:hypothetical protein